MRASTQLRAVLALALAATSWATATPLYHLTDLRIPGETTSDADGINNYGDVVGSHSTPGGTQAFIYRYSAGTMAELGTFGWYGSSAFRINDNGQIAGAVYR